MKKKLKDFLLRKRCRLFCILSSKYGWKASSAKKPNFKTQHDCQVVLYFFFPSRFSFCLQKERERITALSEIHLNAGMSKKELIPKLKRSSFFFSLQKSIAFHWDQIHLLCPFRDILHKNSYPFSSFLFFSLALKKEAVFVKLFANHSSFCGHGEYR